MRNPPESARTADEVASVDSAVMLAAFQELRTGVVVVAPSQDVVVWNGWMERTSGLRASDVIGSSIETSLPDVAGTRFHSAIKSALTQGMSSLLSQSLNPTPLPLFSALASNKERRLEQRISIRPLNVAGARYCLVHIEDVSDAVARIQSAQKQSQLLKQSNDQLQEFAYVVSHDLKAPLRSITSFLGVLEEEIGDRLDESAQECITFAVSAADRMKVLLEDLVTYSRVGSQGKDFEAVDLSDVVASAVENLNVTISESNADVSVGELPTILGDRVQLIQLFQNLIDNGIKYRAPKVAPVIRIAATREGDDVIVSVQDNGIGMRQKDISRIFVMFQRLHGDGEYSGTGIGLAVCKRIVERHRGELSAESEVGQGSTFFCRFPSVG